jgi:hypothetical protein
MSGEKMSEEDEKQDDNAQWWLPVEEDDSGVIHVEQPDRWVTIANTTARDRRVSLAGRGLVLYLMSHKTGWKIRVADLVRQSPEGRDRIYSLINELRRFRYILRNQKRRDNGTYYWKYAAYGVPVGPEMTDEEWAKENPKRKKRKAEGESLPFPEKPDMDKPDTVKPDMVRPDMAQPDTVEPDTDEPDGKTKELLSEELPSQESPTEEKPHTEKASPPGAADASDAGVRVGKSRFDWETAMAWATEEKAADPDVRSAKALAIAAFESGSRDYLIEIWIAGKQKSEGKKLQPADTNCSKCNGSGWETVPGKGARPCQCRTGKEGK